MSGLQTIVLLTTSESIRLLEAVLLAHRPELHIVAAQTNMDLEAIPAGLLPGARLIGFVTGTIVPKRILDALGYRAYNFHPGPPDYPGWAPSHFAVRDCVSRFGATAHEMAEQVDSGPIVDCTWFDVPSGLSAPELEARAFMDAAQLYWNLAPLLASREEPMSTLPIAWGTRRGTRKRLAELYAAEADAA